MPSDTILIPYVTVKVDGTELPDSTEVIEASVLRSLNASAHARIRVLNPDLDATSLTVGKALKVGLGELGGVSTEAFDGVIVAVGMEFDETSLPQVMVDAYDKSYLLSRRSVNKDYVEKSFGDIIEDLVSAVGLTYSGPSGLSAQYVKLQRWGTAESIVTELCQAVGHVWYVDGTTFTVQPRSSEASAPTLTYGIDLRRFRVRANAVDQATKVEVRGWDQASKGVVVGSADGVNNGAPAAIGLQIPVLETQQASSWSRLVSDQTSANKLASGVAGRMAASLVTGRGEAELTLTIVPGGCVELAHVGTDWSGKYFVTSVEHSLSEGRASTRFTVGDETADSMVTLLGRRGGPTAGDITAGLTVGIVTNNKDASADGNKLNRVKVRLPYLSDDVETDWARVLSVGGGAGRGWLTLPEVDDEVLVGFEQGDIRRPYVLGGLWNGKDAAPTNADDAELLSSGKVVRRSFTSRVGHKVTFVDEDSAGAIELTLKSGKAVLLKLVEKDGIELSHADDVLIKIASQRASIELAKGGDVTIKGNNITLDAQQALNLKAGTKIDAKGSTGAAIDGGPKTEVKGVQIDVTASAMANVKGGMVKIN